MSFAFRLTYGVITTARSSGFRSVIGATALTVGRQPLADKNLKRRERAPDLQKTKRHTGIRVNVFLTLIPSLLMRQVLPASESGKHRLRHLTLQRRKL